MERWLEELVWQRARQRCEYCQMSQEFDEPTFQIDHVIAASHGGPTQDFNLALACLNAGTTNHKPQSQSGVKIGGRSLRHSLPGVSSKYEARSE